VEESVGLEKYFVEYIFICLFTK